jgi:signal transduction histidine kinase/ActR/RegA family two-component response regulator
MMLARLTRDPLVRVSLLALVVQGLLLAVLPAGARGRIAYWSDCCLLTAAAAAALRTARGAAGERERRFWRLATVGVVLWLLTSLVNLVPSFGFPDETFYVLTDVLYLVVYFVLIVALSVRPDRPPARGAVPRAVALEHVGTVCFGLSLLAYFVILPFVVSTPTYVTLVPSMSAFVLMDVFFAIRLGWLARNARPHRWRMVYGVLAVGFLATLAHDANELRAYQGGIADESGSPWDLVWTLQFVAITAAAAAGRLVTAERSEAPRRGAAAARASAVTSLVPFAFALPLIHLVGRVAGWLDPLTEGPREILVLAATPLLGGLAIAHQALLARRHRHVRRDLFVTQEQLQQSRKMEALGRLAGGVAHDFNNLLAVILGYSDMLLDRRRDDDRVAGPAEEIRQAAERALALTRQLMTFSQWRQAEGRTFDLDSAVEAIRPLLGRLAGPDIPLEYLRGAGGRSIGTDPQQFERVLINLVANAREAMPDGGRIDVTTRALCWNEEDPARPSTLPPGSYLEVAVADTGPGMTREAQSRAFDPFFTTKDKHEHPGLGLSVVYGIVMQAGGAVRIDTRPGSGTTVRLVFPEVPPQAEAELAGEAPVAPVRVEGRPTVLLAEDDHGFRELMRVALAREGYLVLEAADGRAALDLAARHEGRIDLLLTDLVMPGVDGRRLAERLLPGRPEMHVLFVSGFAGDLLSDFDTAQAGRAFLQKPFTMSELVQRVAEVSGQAAHAAPTS